MHNSILAFSCPHAPYSHPDTIDFLQAVKDIYDCNRIICLGDEVDNAALSRFVKDPNLDSAGTETMKAAAWLKELGEVFPEMDILWSNHGARPYKKAIEAGIPEDFLKTPKEILGAPNGWNWFDKIVLEMPDGSKCLFRHAISSNIIQAIRANGCNVVQGHHHTKFSCEYTNSDMRSFWGLTVGCLINPAHPAFAYGTSNLSQPILGCAVIVEGDPHLVRMTVDKKGRWDGRI